jgi:hypothetical protein
MAAGFIKHLLQTLCRHQFSWPHSAAHGQNYQVCLICGSTYEYDWSTMRRTRRLTPVTPALPGAAESKVRAGFAD